MPQKDRCRESSMFVTDGDGGTEQGQEQRVTAARLAAYTAHEVRNPLAALRAMAQLMLGTSDVQLREAMMRQMVECIDDLDGFLHELLGLAHVDATKFEAVDVASVIDNVVQLFAVHADQIGADVQVRLPTTLSPVRGNPDLLRHVFMNLLKNALEATPGGGPVAITIRHYDRLGTVRVAVRDWGLGIPEEYQGRLFTDISATSRRSGGGVGLPFVHQIVTGIHDGRLWFRTKAGVGTVFYVELPCVAEHFEIQPSPPSDRAV